MSEWIECSDLTPIGGVRVIFYSKRSGLCVGHKFNSDPESTFWEDELNQDRCGDPDDVWDVTHWMPLPKPPIEATNRSPKGTASIEDALRSQGEDTGTRE